MSIQISQTQIDICVVIDELKELLLEKNRKYGDSATHPVRIFSRADTMEQINCRIDDKLSRLRNQQPDEDEDVISDILGYLILRKVYQMQQRRLDHGVA